MQEPQRCWKAFTTIDYDKEGERVVQNENNTTEVLESLWRQSTKMKREKGIVCQCDKEMYGMGEGQRNVGVKCFERCLE